MFFVNGLFIKLRFNDICKIDASFFYVLIFFAKYKNANDIEQDHRNSNRKIGINQSFNLHCYPSTSAALRSKQVLTVRDR